MNDEVRWHVVTEACDGGALVAVYPTDYGEPGAFERKQWVRFVRPPSRLWRWLCGAKFTDDLRRVQRDACEIARQWNEQQRGIEEAAGP